MTSLWIRLFLLCSQAIAFVPTLQVERYSTCCWYKSESNDSLKESSLTHSQSTSFLTLGTHNVLSTSVELWSQEWHDSFVRNGLIDFVPPLSSQLNCLLVDGEISNGVPLKAARNIDENDPLKNAPLIASTTQSHNKEDLVLLHQVFDKLEQYEYTPSDNSDLDCILDRGLLDQLVTSNDGTDKDVGLLLLEATRHLREHGVYIVVTRHQLSNDVKEYLDQVGALLGMQWRFDLDGISNNDVTVSFARKYFRGELPTVGKLATVKIPRP